MNTPIINPWFIYLFDVIDNLHLASFIGMLIALAICMFNAINLDSSYNTEKEIEQYKKGAKRSGVVVIIMCLITTLLPSQKTMMTMYAASFVTPHNIEMVGDGVENTIDYLVDRIEEVVDDGEVE